MESHVQECASCQEILERLAVSLSHGEEPGPATVVTPLDPLAFPGFVIERELGRGAMGVVYQAWQPRLAHRVAIKVVRASIGIGAEDRRRWLREARAIGRVRHPNVVQIHEAGERDGCLYLVLDLIAGGSLAERVNGPLPARVAAGLMVQVARAVEQIHYAGTLHLDIKPSNILLDGLPEEGWDRVTPMLADFGIAWVGDDPVATANGPAEPRGTPSYMAPEQIVGGPGGIGPPADVFALGATLYALLTGRPPFQAASVIETLDLVRTREPAPAQALVPGLPRDLETIAATALRKDPQRRYASAGALADDIERWLDGFPIRARPASTLDHVLRWCRRRPAFASLLGLLAFTVASSLVGLLALWRLSEADRARAETALAYAIESDKAAFSAVHDLVDLITATVDTPRMLMSERLGEASHVVRELTLRPRQDRQFATSNVVAICDLESKLAIAFLSRGGFSEARALLEDSLEILEERRKTVHDPDVDEAYSRALLNLGQCDLVQGRFDAALARTECAGEVLASLVQDPRRLETILLLGSLRRSIATRLGARGLEDQRRKLLETNIRMLESPGKDGACAPLIGLIAAVARLDLAADERSFAMIRAAIRRFPADEDVPAPASEHLGCWIAELVYPSAISMEAAGRENGSAAPGARADAVIRALESNCESLGLNHSVVPIAGYKLACMMASRAAAQRREKRLDNARHTAAWLSAFARTLARRDANEPWFHLILCTALEQEAKNGWQVLDYPVIERTLRGALAEATTALRLSPRNQLARLRRHSARQAVPFHFRAPLDPLNPLP